MMGSPAAHLALLDRLSGTIRPDEEELEEWCASYLRHHRRRFVEDLVIADRYAPPGCQILEVGAVPPLMTTALQTTGRHIIGLDIAPDRFSRCIGTLGLDIRRCDIETEPFPFEAPAFDIVMMNEVFEHLRINPLTTLAEVARVLRPGGLLLLSTPNLASYKGYLNLVRHGHAWAVNASPHVEYQKLRTLGHMGHVREYTPTEIKEFLEHCGFRPTQTIFRGTATGRKERLATRLRPSLLPFFSVVAEKR